MQWNSVRLLLPKFNLKNKSENWVINFKIADVLKINEVIVKYEVSQRKYNSYSINSVS